jgi:hypothetical protein
MYPHHSEVSMSSLLHEPDAFTARDGVDDESAQHSATLCLRTCRDGCSLVDTGGSVVFEVNGRDGRRRCLEFARRAGVLVVLS